MPQNVASVKRERSCSLTASVGYISQAAAERETEAGTGAERGIGTVAGLWAGRVA